MGGTAPSSAGAAVDWFVVSGAGTEGDAEVLSTPGVPPAGAQLRGAHTHTRLRRPGPEAAPPQCWVWCEAEWPAAPRARQGRSCQAQGEPAWRHLLGPHLAIPGHHRQRHSHPPGPLPGHLRAPQAEAWSPSWGPAWPHPWHSQAATWLVCWGQGASGHGPAGRRGPSGLQGGWGDRRGGALMHRVPSASLGGTSFQGVGTRGRPREEHRDPTQPAWGAKQ